MQEQKAWRFNGFLGLFLILILLAMIAFYFLNQNYLLGIIGCLIATTLASGIIIIQPNRAKALIFFGKYKGTIRDSGFWITVPFTIRKSVSLKVRNFNSKTLKVNDIEGNPIEIGAVVVFKVIDSAKAIYDVNDYEQFVEIQSETALRHVATKYPYDCFNETGYSLRSNTEEIATELGDELQSRLAVAGVKVIEARLTHLAYATEIASAMLQRQQASAIVAARQKIVEGAVGMAQMAIEQLQREKVVELDEERKVAMVNNLLVAIVSERSAQPVINTGSLY